MNYRSGVGLVEIVLAVAIFGVIASAVASLAVTGLDASVVTTPLVEAQTYVTEALTAVRTIGDRAFNELNVTASGLLLSGNSWSLMGESTSETIGEFSRRVLTSDVCRDASGDITTCPGVYIDPHAKRVTAEVSWGAGAAARTAQVTTMLTNWASQFWTQTDWSGGSGQAIWSDTTRYELDDGNIAVLPSGSVTLSQNSGGACGLSVWGFTTPTDYTYPPADIEVTSGVARLLSTPGAPASGGLTNSGFTGTIAPWTTGQSAATPAWTMGFTSGGNPGDYGRLQTANTRNRMMIGYFQQSFTVTANTVTSATLDFDWKYVSRSGGLPDVVRFLAYVDTTPGLTLPPNPPAGFVWDSGHQAAITAWQSPAPIDVLSKITGPGTYYVKVAVYVDFNNSTNGTMVFGHDNVTLDWTGTSGGGYPTTSPDITPTTAYTVSNIDAWTGFEEVATIPGGTSITYQLSDDGGTTWQYWNSGWVPAATPSNANAASVITANIATFPTTNQSLTWRAFLTSNGTQQVTLDEVRVWYREVIGAGAAYATYGDIISSAFNMTNSSPVEILEWDETMSACPGVCNIQLQVRTAPDSGGVPGAWTPWYGATGAGTYFTAPTGVLVPTELNGNQWVQYRAELTGDGAGTPTLQEVRINYQ